MGNFCLAGGPQQGKKKGDTLTQSTVLIKKPQQGENPHTLGGDSLRLSPIPLRSSRAGKKLGF